MIKTKTNTAVSGYAKRVSSNDYFFITHVANVEHSLPSLLHNELQYMHVQIANILLGEQKFFQGGRVPLSRPCPPGCGPASQTIDANAFMHVDGKTYITFNLLQ